MGLAPNIEGNADVGLEDFFLPNAKLILNTLKGKNTPNWGKSKGEVVYILALGVAPGAGGGGGGGIAPPAAAAFPFLGFGGGATGTSMTGTGGGGGGSGSFGGSGIGHICIVMIQSGSTIVSQT